MFQNILFLIEAAIEKEEEKVYILNLKRIFYIIHK